MLILSGIGEEGDFLMHDYYSNDIYDTDDFLAHHGVKGMKWGVRRARKSSGGTSSSSGKSKESAKTRAKQSVNKGKNWVEKHKKLLIGIGVGTAAAVGAGTALAVRRNRIDKQLVKNMYDRANMGYRYDKQELYSLKGLDKNSKQFKRAEKILARNADSMYDRETARRFPNLASNKSFGYRQGNRFVKEANLRRHGNNKDNQKFNPKAAATARKKAEKLDKRISAYDKAYYNAYENKWDRLRKKGGK